MAFHRCNCTYVPPQVLDKLATQSDPSTRARARLSAQQAKLSRSQRAVRPVQMSAILAGATASSSSAANREVYHCQHRWEQRYELARAEGDAATADPDVDTVYEFAGIVREYFRTELSRNSIDNLGMKLVLNVHFGEDYMNAFWDGDEMTFGDGDGIIFTSFARSLDVTAHELAHGVTQFTANLDYYSQSGALNEHFSDVFGTVITQRHLCQDAGTADWLVGNEIMGPSLFGEALRSMKAPG
ncbi:MAG: M4 family metallopeptidase, partial [Nitrospirota bacterium]|nr:M4 family metallopeptidase [Nitrospirota bacterium]